MLDGPRTVGGDVPQPLISVIDKLLSEFMDCVKEIHKSRGLRRAVTRSMLSCNTLVLLGFDNISVIGKPQDGIPSSIYVDLSRHLVKPHDALYIAQWDFGYEDPFLIAIPRNTLEQTTEERKPVLEAIASLHVESEYTRVIKITSLIQVNPLFGPASYSLDERLVFVLMPFKENLTTVYNTIIKPTVESHDLVCRRADDFKTNRAIMHDIWKAICEARFIIADLTGLNANVMYELGIAHTIGKETILMNQVGVEEPVKFPFDITHIRRIEYVDNAVGGKKLEEDLSQTIKHLLNPPSIS
ncbi:MAG: hypothetical protein PHI87_05205 [Candidatus Methanomethylophilus sp.]|jgi:hypothetical protein|nr:hypothetical protein [Methanomethylophilus sp.]MDD3064434.1 hypothetical protein [Massilibacteroides sp.]